MLIGNRNTVGFEFLEVANGLAKVDIFVGNHHVTYEDNGHYYPMIINGLKKEIDYLQNNDLSLTKQAQNLMLAELYQTLYERMYGENDENLIQIFETVEPIFDYFCYDLSTFRAYIFAFQKQEKLIFLEKFSDESKSELITAEIDKAEYIQILQTVLDVLIKANPTHQMHQFS